MIRLLPPASWSIEERLQHYLLLLLKTSVAVAVIAAFASGLWELFFVSLLTLSLMFLPELIESWVKLKLPIEFSLVLVLFIYASLFIGTAGGAYELLWWWDVALHASSGFILGFTSFLLLYVQVLRHKIKADPKVVGLIIVSFALAAAVAWEIFEYAMDSIFGTTMQLDSLHDTMWDFIVTVPGAVTMGYIGVKFAKQPQQGRAVKWLKLFIDANPKLQPKKRSNNN